MNKNKTIPELKDYQETIERIIKEPIISYSETNKAKSKKFLIFYYPKSDEIYMRSITGYECNIRIECINNL